MWKIPITILPLMCFLVALLSTWVQERGRLIFRTLAFRGGERNVVMSIKFDGEDRV